MKLQVSDFSDLLQVPLTFEVVNSPEEGAAKLTLSWRHLAGREHRVLFVSGPGARTKFFARQYAAVLASADSRPLYYEVRSASLSEVRRIDALCAERGVSLLIAVGGGTVIDTAKMVVRSRHIALVAIPTALSSDGVASPVSVLSREDGTRDSIASGIPSCVLVDLSITTQAPLPLTLSGVGDLASNASALADARDYEMAGKGQVNGFAKILSGSSYQMILGLECGDMESFKGQDLLARGLIMSGLAMAFAGNSLPCSGGEHLISHALDEIGAGDGTHGSQVALGTLYCAALRDILGRPSIDAAVLGSIRRIGLPADPIHIGISREQFLRAVDLAPEMRPGRFTVLHDKDAKGASRDAYDTAFSK